MITLLFGVSSCASRKDYVLQKESEHFRYYCADENTADIDALSEELESAYWWSASDLKVKRKDKIDLTIYPDIKTFRETVSRRENTAEDEIPEWVCSAYYGGEIIMISPKNTEYTLNPENITLGAKIGVTEILIGEIDKNAPYYLVESTARYESGLYSGVKEAVEKDFENNRFPTLEQVIGMKENDEFSLSYFTLTEYIIDNYGFEKLTDLIKGGDIEKTLGKSAGEIESDWVKYVKRTYLGEEFESAKETEHFIIKYDKSDSDTAEEAGEILECRYEDITNNFGVTSDSKIQVIIYPTYGEFNKVHLHALGYGGMETPAMTGFWADNSIGILSPNDLDGWSRGGNFEELLIHEFTHAVTYPINPKMPTYLMEGTAQYASGSAGNTEFLITVVPALRNGTFPTVDRLNAMRANDYINGLYEYGCAAVQYIAENHGYAKLTEFIKNPDVQTVFGMNEEKFYKGMTDYLKEKYVQ